VTRRPPPTKRSETPAKRAAAAEQYHPPGLPQGHSWPSKRAASRARRALLPRSRGPPSTPLSHHPPTTGGGGLWDRSAGQAAVPQGSDGSSLFPCRMLCLPAIRIAGLVHHKLLQAHSAWGGPRHQGVFLAGSAGLANADTILCTNNIFALLY